MKTFFPPDHERVKTAEQTLSRFHQRIDLWNGTDDIGFIMGYLTGSEPSSLAKAGGGNSAQPNFIEFMQDESVRSKLKELFQLRKTNQIDFHLEHQITQIGLYDLLEKHTFESGNKPWLLVGRFLIMIFPEIFTTVASKNCLDLLARKLDVRAQGYEQQQMHIKRIIDYCLKEMGVFDQLSVFQRAAVG